MVSLETKNFITNYIEQLERYNEEQNSAEEFEVLKLTLTQLPDNA